jgi:hypothetical protein
MQTLQKFIDEKNGKYLDYDGMYGPQCVDLIRYYLRDVLGQSPYAISAAKYAYQMFEKMPEEGDDTFIKIYNSPKNWPVAGDIVFIKITVLGFIYIQHVCLATGGNLKNYISFDQNWPKGKPCMYVNHNYRGCLGWLRPRKSIR